MNKYLNRACRSDPFLRCALPEGVAGRGSNGRLSSVDPHLGFGGVGPVLGDGATPGVVRVPFRVRRGGPAWCRHEICQKSGMARSWVVNNPSEANGYFAAPLYVLVPTDRLNLRPDNLEEFCARRPVNTILQGVVRMKLLYDQGAKTLEPVIVR